jgi:hypothetical protein
VENKRFRWKTEVFLFRCSQRFSFTLRIFPLSQLPAIFDRFPDHDQKPQTVALI